jgi:hypothetical protein
MLSHVGAFKNGRIPVWRFKDHERVISQPKTTWPCLTLMWASAQGL